MKSKVRYKLYRKIEKAHKAGVDLLDEQFTQEEKRIIFDEIELEIFNPKAFNAFRGSEGGLACKYKAGKYPYTKRKNFYHKLKENPLLLILGSLVLLVATITGILANIGIL